MLAGLEKNEHIKIFFFLHFVEECQQLSLTTMNLDLRDPMEITSVPDLKVDLDEINEDGDDNEDVVVVTTKGKY